MRYVDEDFWPLNTTLYVRDFHGNSPKWVALLLRHLKLDTFAASTGVPSLNRNFVHPVLVARPSVDEQRGITEVLDAIDGAIEKTEAVIEATERLRAALLGELLTRGVPGWHTEWKDVPGIGTIPACWDVARLGDVADVRYGLGQPPVDGGGEPVAIVRATNIKRGRIIATDLLMVGRDGLPKGKNPYLKTGDIIVVRSGAYTGDIAFIGDEWAGTVAGYDLVVSPRGIDPLLLSQYLLGSVAQAHFRSQRDRSAQPHLNSQDVADTLVPLPSGDEQGTIARTLAAVDLRTQEDGRTLGRLATVKTALAGALLSGRVRVGLIPWLTRSK